MKKYLIILTAFVLCFASCKKETEGISKETSFPVLSRAGDEIIYLKKGEAFTDPGVTATEGDKDLEVKTSGTVDTNVAGVYTLTYSAINSDGYPGSTTRKVVVSDIAADAAANDLSGSYARSTNGSLAVWTKVAPGVYSVFNPGGAPGTDLTVIVFNPTVSRIFIPEQVSSDGSITKSSSEVYNPATATYSWIIVNPGYGTALRTFVKK
jgi:hypothetical protein